MRPYRGGWTAGGETGFAALTITGASTTPSIGVTAPTAGPPWPAGSTQSVGWTTTAVSVGTFDTFLMNTTTGAWYFAGTSPAVAAQTTYTLTFSTVGIPAGSYKAIVQYRPDAAIFGGWTAGAETATGIPTIQ